MERAPDDAFLCQPLPAPWPKVELRFRPHAPWASISGLFKWEKLNPIWIPDAPKAERKLW